MREILTQAEVDALLEACDRPENTPAPAGGSRLGTPFDFHARKQVGEAQQAVVEAIRADIAKGVAAHLSRVLRRDIRVAPVSAYGEAASRFLGQIGDPACVGLLSVENLRSSAYLAVTPFLAYSIIDLMLGGEGRIEEPEGKEFTPIEIRLVRRILDGIAGEVAKAWSRFGPLALRFEKVETNPKMLPSRESPDPLFVMAFRLEADGGLSRDFSVALPFSLVGSLRSAEFARKPDEPTNPLPGMIRNRLHEIPVEVTGILGEAHLPVREILSLQAGDVVTTTREVTAPVVVLVGGMPKFHGRPGVSNGNRAVKIVSR